MSINVGELVATMRLNDQAFTGQLRDARGRFVSQAQQTGQEGGQALSRGVQQGAAEGKTGLRRIWAEIGEEFQGNIKKMLAGAAVIAGGQKLIGFFRDSIDAASDMNETVSKSGVIFGQNAGKIQDWAKTAATSLGVSQQAAIAAAAGFGDMFLQLGLGADQAADMSTSTVQLAADLGSFSNLETQDVLDRISGALRGEYDSLQAVIPNINAARVEHEALAATGKTAASELTAAEKAQATLAIVTADGARAMGDFARTSDGAANTSKILAAQWSDLQVEIGNRLMPAWQAFQDLLGIGIGILGDLVGIVGTAVDWFSQLPGPVKAGALAFASWVLIGPQVIGFVKGLAFVLPTILSGMGGVAGAARAAGAGLLAAFGGPIGLAILGVTAAIGFMISQTDKAEVSVSDFTDAIDENTGKLKANSTESIAAATAQSGHLQAYKAIGGAVGDYTDALEGNTEAQDRVHTQLLDQAEAALRNSKAWDQMVAKGLEVPANARKVASGLLEQGSAGQYASEQMDAVLTASAAFASDADVLATAAEAGATKLEAVAESAGNAGAAADDATDPMQDLKDATKELGDKADAASVAADFLWQSLMNLPGVTVDAQAASRALEAAFRDMVASARGVQSATLDVGNAQARTAEAQAKYDQLASHLGQTLDGQAVSATNLAVTQADVDQASRDLTAAQLNEQQAVADVTNAQDDQFKAMQNAAQQAVENIGKSYALKAATGDVAGATRDAEAATEEARKKFVDAAVQMGYTESQANDLANQYGLIPSQVATTFITHGAEDARAKADALNEALNRINNREVHYTVVGGEVTTEGTRRATSGGLAVFAEGGMVQGHGAGRSDIVPILASDGELVQNAAAVAHRPNRAVMEWMNRGGKFADGGLVLGDYLSQSWSPGLSGSLDKLNAAIKKTLAPMIVGYNASAGVEQWRGLALQALAATGEDASNITALLYQMQTESGGNPNAINLWDINAQRGYPSQGLLQVIPPTFVSALSGTQFANLIPRGPTDPWANIIASILYARRRYGSLQNAYKGRAYDSGGEWPDDTAGWNTSGESEFVLPGPAARAMGLLPGGHQARGMLALPDGGQVGGGRQTVFTGPIQVGSFQSAADLVNHAFYAGI